MVRYLIVAALLFSALARAQCELTPTQAETFLAQDFDTFDQKPEGWRSLYSPGGTCDLVIAQLIDSYHLTHQASMLPWQDRLSYWHAGQSYAFAKLDTVAVRRFENSFDPDEPASPAFHWNAYARATIAFLKRDRAALEKARDEFVTVSPLETSNYKIVLRFLRCFNASYFEAYSGGGGCP